VSDPSIEERIQRLHEVRLQRTLTGEELGELDRLYAAYAEQRAEVRPKAG
jgi:hypothetical protein